MNPSETLALKKHLKKALPVAIKAAHEAGAFISKKFGKFKSLSSKADSSLVTEVDQHAEKIVIKRLQETFPHDCFLGEESGITEGLKKSPYRWHIDPLDGTTNFVHGFPIFCVSIGLEYKNEPVLGVIYQPIGKNTYTAYLGAGAYKNGKKIHVSKTKNLKDALLVTGFSVRKKEFFKQEMAAFSKAILSSHAIRRTGSAAMDLVFVSTGQFDGFWEWGLKPWDVTAGLCILKEAGGTFTQIGGKKYRIGDPNIVTSNTLLHSSLIKTLGN